MTTSYLLQTGIFVVLEFGLFCLSLSQTRRLSRKTRSQAILLPIYGHSPLSPTLIDLLGCEVGITGSKTGSFCPWYLDYNSTPLLSESEGVFLFEKLKMS
jgi:hypothetical protein